MFTILEEDVEKLLPEIGYCLYALATCHKRNYSGAITTGENLPVFRLTGQWVGEGIQIGIEVINHRGNS